MEESLQIVRTLGLKEESEKYHVSYILRLLM